MNGVPLHSFRYVYSSLVTSTTFDLNQSPSESAQYGEVHLKYKSFIEIISKNWSLWKRYAAKGRFTMMPEVLFEKFRVGSQFFVVTYKHALVVIKDWTLWRKFKLLCYQHNECFPEEHYFPTLLSMADPNGLLKGAYWVFEIWFWWGFDHFDGFLGFDFGLWVPFFFLLSFFFVFLCV